MADLLLKDAVPDGDSCFYDDRPEVDGCHEQCPDLDGDMCGRFHAFIIGGDVPEARGFRPCPACMEARAAAAVPSLPLSALLSLLPGATAETVLDRVREGERARRAWGWLRSEDDMHVYHGGDRNGHVGWWATHDTEPTNARGPFDAPLAAALAAMDAQGDGK